MDDLERAVEVRRVCLEKLRLRTEIFHTLPLLERQCNTLRTTLEVEILAKALEPVVVGRFPAGWWQAFRERWLPKWWLRRYPVQYTGITVRGWELYPEVEPPPDGHMVWWEVLETPPPRYLI